MPVHNADIAAIFAEIADLQEITGENPFRIRAYRNAARVVADSPRELRELVAAGDDLTRLDGIGGDLAKKIEAIIATGTVQTLEDLRKKFPPGITDLLRIQGLGPKRVKVLLDDLKIKSREELMEACREARVSKLKGFGDKLEAQIFQALQNQSAEGRRFRRSAVAPYAETLLAYLQKVTGVSQVTIAGSYRRGRETVGDLDILCVAASASPVMLRFTAYDEVRDILAQGPTKSSVVLKSGIQVDLRVVSRESIGAALLYFTGSQAFNIALRRRAQERGLKLNEYGLFRADEKNDGAKNAGGAESGSGIPLGGKTEDEIFHSVEIPAIPPELREGRGEIEAALAGKLPKLVGVRDIRGDLHNHSDWSDGTASIEEMARAAKALGYEYVAITDHSKRLTIANGLNEERLRRQIDEVDKVNSVVRGIRVLKGSEVDILDDGSLDLSDEILSRLDLVVASVHHKFNLSEAQQTERVMRAMDNKYFSILAHPTGRLLGERPGYEINIPRVIEHAKQRGCFIELNSNPARLDIDDRHCRAAKEAGVLVSIDTDAHSTRDFENIKHGVMQARRGWLETKDVLNAKPLGELLAVLKGARR